jgi:predicted small integral membrane protein
MGVFFKLASLGAVIGGGSLVMLSLLLGGYVALAWLTLAGTISLAAVVIVLIARETRSTDRAPR